MAFPFGGHPTFAQYCTWAADRENCSVNTCTVLSGKGQSMCVTRIKAPSGRYVIATDYSQAERLVPSTIAYFDRRLGLRSPFTVLDS